MHKVNQIVESAGHNKFTTAVDCIILPSVFYFVVSWGHLTPGPLFNAIE